MAMIRLVLSEPTAAEKIAWMKRRVAELKEVGVQVEVHLDIQASTVDPDARLLKTQGVNRQVCYKVQSSVDTNPNQYGAAHI